MRTVTSTVGLDLQEQLAVATAQLNVARNQIKALERDNSKLKALLSTSGNTYLTPICLLRKQINQPLLPKI